jgi:hypothetical protein
MVVPLPLLCLRGTFRAEKQQKSTRTIWWQDKTEAREAKEWGKPFAPSFFGRELGQQIDERLVLRRENHRDKP